MIFKFAIDPGFLETARQQKLEDSVFEQHEQFLKMWCHYGALVSDIQLETFLNSQVSGMHQEIRKRWQEAIRQKNRFRRVEVNKVSKKPLWEVETSSDVEELNEQVQTVFVDQRKRPTLQQSWERDSEICSFQAPGRSNNLLVAQELDQVGISPIQREDLWQKYFQPLAEISQNVVIVDRYAVDNLIDFADPSKVKDVGGGMNFLFKKLTQLPSKITVKVIAAVLKRDGESSNYFPDLLDARRKDLDSNVNPYDLGSIRKLTFCLLPNSVFRDEVHYRFIRFDKTYISTDKGVSVFDLNFTNSEVQRATLKRYIYPDNVCQQAEKELDYQGAQNERNRIKFS